MQAYALGLSDPGSPLRSGRDDEGEVGARDCGL